MAEANHPEPAQIAHSSNVINYGHFGTATYDSQSQTWSFLRQSQPIEDGLGGSSTRKSPFKLIKGPTKVIDAAPLDDFGYESSKGLTGNSLLKSLPGVVPALEHCVDTISMSDPLASETHLLAFGNALILGSNDDQSGFQVAPIVAHVSHVDPSKLTLTLLDRESAALDQHTQIQVPCISMDESASWFSGNGRILQLYFASASSKQEATWLALRQNAATTIFQPLLHHTLVTYAKTTALETNPMIEIPITRTGGLQHADLAFHPEDTRHIAIVDTGGNWSIWRIHGKRSRSAHNLHRARLAASGSIVSEPEVVEQLDGWHKLIWLRNNAYAADYLLVANRKKMKLFSKDGLLICEQDIKIGRKGETWNLELLPGMTSSEFFVLTSSHIFVMSVTFLRRFEPGSPRNATLKTLASWSHFLNPNDCSLSLHSLRWAHASWLFLSSNIDGLTASYQLLKDAHNVIRLRDVPTPVLLNSNFDGILNPQVLELQAVAAESSTFPSQYKNLAVFKVFLQRDDNSVFEVLYQILDQNHVTSTLSDAMLVPKKDISKYKSDHRLAATVVGNEDDDFVVGDGDTGQADVELTVDEMLTSQVSSLTLDNTIASRCWRICDLRDTYDELATKFPQANAQESDDIEDILEAIGNIIDGNPTTQLLSEMFWNSSKPDASLVEFEHDSRSLFGWLQERESEGDRIEYGPLLSSALGSERKLLTDIYDDLLDIWVSSLPVSLPDRLRAQRERVLRHVALQMYLSSISITSGESNDLHDTRQPGQEPNTAISSAPSDFRSDDDLLSTSPMPASGQTVIESTDYFSTLRQYVSFKQPDEAIEAIATSVSDILAHLPTSSTVNPDDYSYNDAELNLAVASNEQKLQEMDAKSRRKVEKLARARQRQLEKQANAKKAAIEQSTSVPLIMSSQMPVRTIQSSQAAPLSSSQPGLDSIPLLSMTQPERGAYGKREPLKAKSKRKEGRKKGF